MTQQNEVESTDCFLAVLDKKNRNSNKKLREIKDLLDKKKNGEELNESQQEKVGQKQSIKDQIAEVEGIRKMYLKSLKDAGQSIKNNNNQQSKVQKSSVDQEVLEQKVQEARNQAFVEAQTQTVKLLVNLTLVNRYYSQNSQYTLQKHEQELGVELSKVLSFYSQTFNESSDAQSEKLTNALNRCLSYVQGSTEVVLDYPCPVYKDLQACVEKVVSSSQFLNKDIYVEEPVKVVVEPVQEKVVEKVEVKQVQQVEVQQVTQEEVPVQEEKQEQVQQQEAPEQQKKQSAPQQQNKPKYQKKPRDAPKKEKEEETPVEDDGFQTVKLKGKKTEVQEEQQRDQRRGRGGRGGRGRGNREGGFRNREDGEEGVERGDRPFRGGRGRGNRPQTAYDGERQEGEFRGGYRGRGGRGGRGRGNGRGGYNNNNQQKYVEKDQAEQNQDDAWGQPEKKQEVNQDSW